MPVRFNRVKSTNLSAVAYDKTDRILLLKFKMSGEKIYPFKNVPQHIHSKLMQAESIGTYFHTYIKNKYTQGDPYYAMR